MELSGVKNELINRVFDEVLKRLKQLSDDEYEQLFERWLADVGEGGGEIVVNERDLKRLSGGMLDRINSSLKEEDRFTLCSEPQEMAGGFILRRKGFEIDMRLESMLQSLREEILPEVAERLFGEVNEE